jgi:hypothetical protein
LEYVLLQLGLKNRAWPRNLQSLRLLVRAILIATAQGLAYSGSVGVSLVMSDEDLRLALADILAIKRAFRANDMNAAWKAIRALELKLGRGLRTNGDQP